jgi:hypothetical protein
MEPQRTYWRLCSSCKRELAFESTYYVCSVSTCNRKRMALTFCSLPCFEAHVPTVRHREAWAEQRRAPTRQQYEQELAEEAQEAARPAPLALEPAQGGAPRRIVATSGGRAEPNAAVELEREGLPRDILIVVSKLKAYVRARSGMNTSDGAMEVLSDHVRELCDAAIQRAASEGRKTVLPRDF